MTDGLTCILYLRQSDSEGEGEESLIIEAHESLLREHAESRGWRVVDVFRDIDLRGWQDERERVGLAAAMARCKAGAVDILLVFELSRFARRLRLQENLLHELAQYGTELASYREPWVGTPLFRQIVGAFAEEQTRVISGFVRSALRGRARRGLAHGIIPYGYRKPVPGGVLDPDPATAPIVLDLFVRYAAGEGATRIAEDLTRRGIPSPREGTWWRLETLAAILDNRVYLGEVVLNGERIAGAHPAIVDAATWDRAAARRAAKHRPPRRKPVASWLEGLIWHACGERMHLHAGPPSKPGEQPRFRCWLVSHAQNRDRVCTVHPQQIPAYRAEPAVRARLAADLGARLSLDEVVAAAAAEARQRDPLLTIRRRELEDRRRRAEQRRGKAEELYLTGARDRAWFDAQDAAAAAELADVARELVSLPAPPDVARLRLTARQLRDVAPIIERAPDARLREILGELGVVVLGADGLTVRYHPHVTVFLRAFDGS